MICDCEIELELNSVLLDRTVRNEDEKQDILHY